MQNEKGNAAGGGIVEEGGEGLVVGRKNKAAGTYRRKQLWGRDIKLLKFVCEQYFMSRSQIMRWLRLNYDLENTASAKTVMIRILQLLRSQGLIRPFRSMFLDFAEAFLVTTKGIRLLQDYECIPKNLNYTPIDEEKLRHDALVTTIRMAWESTMPIYHWIPERVLRDGSKRDIPDAVVVVKGMNDNRPYLRVAIEVETTLKSLQRYRNKFYEYEDSYHDLVMYFSDDKKIRKAILETSSEISDKICICSASDFVKVGGVTEGASHQGVFILKDQFDGETRRRKTDFDHIDCDWAEWGNENWSDRPPFAIRFK